jgi:predicted nucleic acid-binding protein
MGVILDASVLIAAERRTLRFEDLLRSRAGDPVALAAITAAELLHGCHRARDPAVRARRAAYVEWLLESIPIVPFGLPEARRHAALWADLAEAGAPIGPYDMLVGATALSRGYALATLNRGEFARIPGLTFVALDAFLT